MKVSVGDIELFVDDSGMGAPVILQPGLGYASWCWQPLVEHLRGYRTLAVDTRGAGRSDKPEGPYSIDMFADDIAAVLDALDLPRAHVVGHSMGGFVAQRFAARHPNRAHSITVVASHPGQPGALPLPDETMALWEEASSLDSEGYARTTFSTSFRPGWAEEHADRFAELLQARLEFPTPPERWRDHFDAGAAFSATTWPKGEITCPTLVVHGTEDRVVPFGNAAALCEHIPHAQLAVFEGAGHNLALEEPQKMAELLEEFYAHL